jgi:HSP20 family molecular chaperone IbpA
MSIPVLQPGENVILQSQGAYRHSRASGWKVAHGLLTNHRFVTFLGKTVRFEIPLSQIKGLAIEKTFFVIRTKECLRLSYEAGRGRSKKTIWFLVNDVRKWKKTIYQLSLLELDQETIEKIAAQLDSDSQDILWYLWEQRHARIDHLADLIHAPNHMHVLLKIRETINPVADQVIGCPLLSFERSKVDSETGEAVLFSWWMMGKQEKCAYSEDRLLDIFDEGHHIQVIMEVRGLMPSDLILDVDGDHLTVRSHKIGASLKETFHLPAEVTADNYSLHMRNNLLEIKLHRAGSKNLQRTNLDPAQSTGFSRMK